MRNCTSRAAHHIPSTVYFDLDNTFYEYENTHNLAMDKTLERVENALGIGRETFLSALNSSKRQIKGRLGNTAASHSRLLYFKTALEELGFGPQPLLTLELEQVYWSSFLREMKLFEGVIDLLEELRVAGVSMALVTDLTAQIQLRKIVYLGIEKYFDVIVTSEEAGEEKPSAGPFALAKELMGDMQHERWFVGDSGDKDIVGARTHLDAICFQRISGRNSIGQGPALPDYSFESFLEIRSLLSGLRRKQ